MKVIAFATSNSSQSINKQLVTYAASLVENADVEVLDLNDFELPLFSQDLENQIGHHQVAKDFLATLGSADKLIMSTAEHNGNYPAVWKNLFDWCTRIELKVFQDKPMVLLSTSPGGRGGANVMDIALNSLPRFGAEIKAHLSVPSFHDNFDTDAGELKDGEYKDKLRDAIKALQA